MVFDNFFLYFLLEIYLVCENIIGGIMQKTKKVICLYGGPGTGKSTTASLLYGLLKLKGHNAELIREYVKDWVWEGRKIKETDQIYILANQARKEQICFKDADVLVTDSPIRLCAIYEKIITTPPFVVPTIINKLEDVALKQGVEYVHIFLNRVKNYNEKGRLQKEEEAKKIDDQIKQHLIESNINFLITDANEQAPETIYNLIKDFI